MQLKLEVEPGVQAMTPGHGECSAVTCTDLLAGGGEHCGEDYGVA